MHQHDLNIEHNGCRRNRAALAEAGTAACFHCCTVYTAAEIHEWIDGGESALCPHCGIDAVLPMRPTYDSAFLEAMHERWFNTTVG